ncbi:MAG TPA: zinc ribbon domain-containing protein [Polyangia bacterium]|nr:zinc ribbon domain-containing protein [Polyangia bacterium]
MPIYEYACGACGHRFEEWQKMSDAPVRTCPKCKAKKVEKLISATSFTLKGGGWYADLYGSSKAPGSAAEATGGSSSSEPKSESKSEPKAESKSESKGSSDKPSKKAKKTGAA